MTTVAQILADDTLTPAQRACLTTEHTEAYRLAQAAQGSLVALLCGGEVSSRITYAQGTWQRTAALPPQGVTVDTPEAALAAWEQDRQAAILTDGATYTVGRYPAVLVGRERQYQTSPEELEAAVRRVALLEAADARQPRRSGIGAITRAGAYWSVEIGARVHTFCTRGAASVFVQQAKRQAAKGNAGR